MQISSYPIAENLSDSDVMVLDQETGTKALSVGGLREYFNISNEGTGLKAGVIYPFASSEIPEGFLACDGTAYSRTEYAELFAVIGTTYGIGDGSTTFNVPDLRGRTLINKSPEYNIGTSGGNKDSNLNGNGYANIYVNGKTVAADSFDSGNSYTCSTLISDINATGGVLTNQTKSWKTNLSGSLPVMQPYTVVNYIISTGKGTGVNVDALLQGQNILPLSIENGGTGGTTADTALTNLGVKDHIVAEGDSGIWHYVKYASGWAECWGKHQQNVTFQSLGSTAISISSSFYTFPEFPFDIISLFNIEINYVTENTDVFDDGYRWNTNLNQGTNLLNKYQTRLLIASARTDTYTVPNINFKIHISGFWK